LKTWTQKNLLEKQQKDWDRLYYNKWDQERAERERQEREADQRAKARYDARTNQLKAEYDARTAAGWGKTGAERNFRNDADYWKNQQKKY